jgi:hypothetical protein
MALLRVPLRIPQVADWFHPLLNLSDAIKRMLDRHGKELSEVAKQVTSLAIPPAQETLRGLLLPTKRRPS